MLETTIGITCLVTFVIGYPIYQHFSQITVLKYVDFSKIIPTEKAKW